MATSPQPAWLRLATRLLGRGRGFALGLSYAFPPYLGAGVRVTHASEDLSEVDVEMRLRWWNRNYVGTHFGGSLFSMVDPFWMLMLIDRVGDRFVVWDKAGTIRFLRPGRGTVRARFRLDDARVDALLARFEDGVRSVDEVFSIDIVDEAGDVIATVDKTVYLRRKDLPRPA